CKCLLLTRVSRRHLQHYNYVSQTCDGQVRLAVMMVPASVAHHATMVVMTASRAVMTHPMVVPAMHSHVDQGARSLNGHRQCRGCGRRRHEIGRTDRCEDGEGEK
ncbi:hypothetical protein, partial [Methylobacterium iners]|uniref:hypothetical protein n=1 Tax=Methylobacterium iners TaxID=418707 RepID=UPI001EE1D76A